jgi:hypothetical protein
MQVPAASEDDRLSKAALFTKYTEALPAAVGRWRQLGVPLLLELLAGVRAAVDGLPSSTSSGASSSATSTGSRAFAQRLFAQAQGFTQVCNVLNAAYPLVRVGGCSVWLPVMKT